MEREETTYEPSQKVRFVKTDEVPDGCWISNGMVQGFGRKYTCITPEKFSTGHEDGTIGVVKEVLDGDWYSVEYETGIQGDPKARPVHAYNLAIPYNEDPKAHGERYLREKMAVEYRTGDKVHVVEVPEALREDFPVEIEGKGSEDRAGFVYGHSKPWRDGPFEVLEEGSILGEPHVVLRFSGTEELGVSEHIVHPANLELVEKADTDSSYEIRRECEQLAEFLVGKNEAYGDSILDPLRIFSKNSDPRVALLARIDDKLSRLARGKDYPGDDDVRDLTGYLVMLRVLEKQEKRKS